jgi:hypothetical protein
LQLNAISLAALVMNGNMANFKRHNEHLASVPCMDLVRSEVGSLAGACQDCRWLSHRAVRAEESLAGVFANFMSDLTPWFALAAVVDASFQSDRLVRQRFTRGPTTGGTIGVSYTVDTRRSAYAFMLGPRFQSTSAARVRPAGFARTGLVRTSSAATVDRA